MLAVSCFPGWCYTLLISFVWLRKKTIKMVSSVAVLKTYLPKIQRMPFNSVMQIWKESRTFLSVIKLSPVWKYVTTTEELGQTLKSLTHQNIGNILQTLESKRWKLSSTSFQPSKFYQIFLSWVHCKVYFYANCCDDNFIVTLTSILFWMRQSRRAWNKLREDGTGKLRKWRKSNSWTISIEKKTSPHF